MRLALAAIVVVVIPVGLAAQRGGGGLQSPSQTEANEYTRYELLDPGSGKFRIWYEVTATTPGATHFDNPIRKGSVASDERVLDAMSGKPLEFANVNGLVARTDGVRGADSASEYIRVTLARPVPKDGEGRVIIDKTYFDPQSYLVSGDQIVFTRSLGIKRNEVVLPPGYELVSSNFPAQILEQADGRVAVSFWNNGPSDAPLTMRARPLAAQTVPRTRGEPYPADRGERLAERAQQTESATYDLGDPEKHSFQLTREFTVYKPGTSIHDNIALGVVGTPHGLNLDTGDDLSVTMQAFDRGARGKTPPGLVPGGVIVAYTFPAIVPGGSARIRTMESFADEPSYQLAGDELVLNVTASAPAVRVVLPLGWRLANCSVPGTVTQDRDGRIHIDIVNGRTDSIPLLVTAHRR